MYKLEVSVIPNRLFSDTSKHYVVSVFYLSNMKRRIQNHVDRLRKRGSETAQKNKSEMMFLYIT